MGCNRSGTDECDGTCKEPGCDKDCQYSACHRCQKHHDEQPDVNHNHLNPWGE